MKSKEDKMDIEGGISPEQESSELEQDLHEVIDKAGERSLEESTALWDNVQQVLNREQRRGEGKIHQAETIDQIKTGEKDSRHFVEGGIGYHRIESGKIICTSDAHGDFESLSATIRKFIKLKSSGEKVSFSFSGDFCSSDTDKDRFKLAEMVYAAKSMYPNEVFIEPGNADKGHIPLFMGMGTDIAQKFLGEDFSKLEKKALEAMNGFIKEQGIEKPPAFLKHLFIGAMFLGEARACGVEKFNPQDFSSKFIYGELKDIAGVKKNSPLFERNISRNLISATQDYRLNRITDIDPEKIKAAFTIYRKLSRAFESQPMISIISTPHGNMVLSHTWPVKMGKLSELVYDPIEQRQAAWTKYFKDQEGIKEEKGYHHRYGPDTLAKWFSKNNVVLGQFGHNHGNRLQKIASGVYRIETSVSAKRAAKEQGPEVVLSEAGFAEIDISKLSDPKNAIEFQPVKKG